MALICAMICGPVALYASFGASYFASWTEEEEPGPRKEAKLIFFSLRSLPRLMELERLYRERGRGESLVLSAPFLCHSACGEVFLALVSLGLLRFRHSGGHVAALLLGFVLGHTGHEATRHLKPSGF